MKKVPVYSVIVPEYHFRSKPDFRMIGQRVDAVIRKNFMGKKIAVRAVSSKEHRGLTRDGLIKIVSATGTDRYNLKRKGDRYGNIQNRRIDFFALDFKVGPKNVMMEKLIEPFYTYPIRDGRKPIRLDIAILYDRTQLKCVPHTYDGKRIKRDGFIFRHPDARRDALFGMIKIR